MKVQCAIIDDEPYARMGLSNYFADIPYLELAVTAGSIKEYQALSEGQTIDLLFLDIHLPETDGLSYLKTTHPEQMIIITTAYPQYALEGYDLNVLDYLVKPISQDRFRKSAEKAHELLKLKRGNHDHDNMHFLAKVGNRTEKIYLNKVLFIESLSNYVKVYLEDGIRISYNSLYKIEEECINTPLVRVHRSYMVNKEKIDACTHNKIYIQKHQVPVSDSFKPALKNLMAPQLGEKSSQ